MRLRLVLLDVIKCYYLKNIVKIIVLHVLQDNIL